MNGDGGVETLTDEVVTLDTITAFRRHLRELVGCTGLATEATERFVLAVHEAVANAIRHAGGRSEVAVVRDDERRLIAEVQTRDRASQAPSPSRCHRRRRPAGGACGWSSTLLTTPRFARTSTA